MGWGGFQEEAAGGNSWGTSQGMPSGDDFESLVAQIKTLQRTDPEGKEQWIAYVEQQGEGKRDPSKHNPEFLQTFLTQLQSGTRLPTGGCGGTAGGEDALVAQIKELQRRDPTAKEQWVAYVHLGGQGLRDPAKHSPEFLEAFLQQLQSGDRGGTSASEDLSRLPEIIKMMQKRSTTFKGVWAHFCQQHGHGRNDPTKHDPSYHVKFLDFLAHQASNSMSMGPTMGLLQIGGGGAPLKRMRLDSGIGLGTMMGGGSAKEELVTRVKAFQRMGGEQKELWGRYADTFLRGLRDPSRHDPITLQEFCDNHGVPEAEAERAPSNMSNGPMGGGGGGGEKEQLANRVKGFQRTGVEQKELWGAYADTYLQGVRDPSRHDADTLREFCSNHGIP